MNYKLFVKSYQGLRITAAFLFALTFLLSISGVLLSFKMFNYSETVVLVPPHLNERVKVALNKSDIGYKKSWGLFLAELLGNATPSNIDFIKDSLNNMLSPDVYNEFSEKLEEQIINFKREHLTQRFEPSLVIYDEVLDKVFVTGRSVIQGPSGNEIFSMRTFEFGFEFDNFQPMLTYMDTFEGSKKNRLKR